LAASDDDVNSHNNNGVTTTTADNADGGERRNLLLLFAAVAVVGAIAIAGLVVGIVALSRTGPGYSAEHSFSRAVDEQPHVPADDESSYSNGYDDDDDEFVPYTPFQGTTKTSFDEYEQGTPSNKFCSPPKEC